jgi:competence protein ComFC
MEIITDLLDFFLPRFCPSCNKKLTAKEYGACVSCFASIRRIDGPGEKETSNFSIPPGGIISGFHSLFIFEKEKALQALLHEFKYNGKFGIAVYLGEMWGRTYAKRVNDWKLDYLVPIPLHHLKRAERGYNQSLFIAKGINGELKLKVAPRLIKRSKYTESQTALTIPERRENVNGAFKAKHRSRIKGKNILLVDDVITTGATLTECGRVLLEAGAAKVYAGSIAIAGKGA